jgi:endoglucanase
LNHRLWALVFIVLLPVAAEDRGPISPNIRLDQVGYLPAMSKLASFAGNISADLSWELVRDSDRKVVLRGVWSTPRIDPDSGDEIRIADFSTWHDAGNYHLYAPGSGSSWPFRIANNVYEHALYLAARSFYGQRCGTAVDLGKEFPGYRHEVCHQSGGFDPSSGRQGPRPSQKGWHDAGDYGRYVVNSGITTATLLWAVEFNDERLRRLSLNIPESGNGTPDLLSEIRWNLDWMLTMQDQDGGVWHKQTSAHFCGFVPPEQDTLPSLIIGSGHAPFKTSCATADFAAVMAIAARTFSRYDPIFSKRCLDAARSAWQWVNTHDQQVFHNPVGVATGEYGDADCSDEQLWAAAELARTTKDAAFENYFQAHYKKFLPNIEEEQPPDNLHMAAFALWTYALGDCANKNAIREIEARSISAADQITGRTLSSAYGVSLVRKNYIWGSTSLAANYALQLLVAQHFKDDARYKEAALDNLHYILGRNATGFSFVTQLGSNPVQHIHHRPSAGHDQPWPGLMSGGPNQNREDEEMRQHLPSNIPPAKAFLDLQASYASNEVAINWNAPLVFVLAAIQPN